MLARLSGITQKQLRALVRLSYIKVAEYQRRGLVHLHAVIRLDRAMPAYRAHEIKPPPARFTSERFADAIRATVGEVSAPLPDELGADAVGWGDELDIRPLEEHERHDVAAYLAKYATKSTEQTGGVLHRVSQQDLARLPVRDHVRSYLRAAFRLAARPPPADRRFGAWALAALSARPDGHPEAAGLLVLTVDGAIVMSDAAAEHWLAELEPDGRGDGPPHVIAAVARRARVTDDALHARARVRTPAGTWLIVRASELSGDGGPRTAVTLEPARAHELAPLIADAYALTERERAVTQLVAQGLPTAAIATSLHISTWTVQDHLKAIFVKVNVSSRGELVARVFFEHYAPRLAEQAPLDQTGWYAALTPTRTA